MTKRHVSSSDLWNSLARSRALWPTLLKRMSMRPNLRLISANASRTATASVQSAVMASTCRPSPSMAPHLVQRLVLAVHDGEVGALAGQAQRAGATDPVRRAGDDSDPAREPAFHDCGH
jgi:hypothetical protein